MIDMKRLAGLPMFDAMGPNQRHAMASVLTTRQLGPGDALFKQGDKARTCYWILEGGIDVQAGGKERKHLARLKKGELFGEVALLDGGRRSATCAGGPRGAMLAELSKSDFDRIFDEGSSFAFHLMDVIGQQLSVRFRSATAQLTEIAMRTDPQ